MVGGVLGRFAVGLGFSPGSVVAVARVATAANVPAGRPRGAASGLREVQAMRFLASSRRRRSCTFGRPAAATNAFTHAIAGAGPSFAAAVPSTPHSLEPMLAAIFSTGPFASPGPALAGFPSPALSPANTDAPSSEYLGFKRSTTAAR